LRKQSERNVEQSFPRTETDVVVESTIQSKNIHATEIFLLIHEFKTTPSFSNTKIGQKPVFLRVSTVCDFTTFYWIRRGRVIFILLHSSTLGGAKG
jgi:hypothetical protein